jgi:hypothetical protein
VEMKVQPKPRAGSRHIVSISVSPIHKQKLLTSIGHIKHQRS